MTLLNNRKICIVGPGLKMGGVERASSNLANALNRHGESVTYIALFQLEYFFKLNPNINFVEPDDFNKGKLSFFKTILWLRRLLKKHKPNVIIVYSIFYAALTSLALLGKSYPIFLSERSSPLYRWPRHVRLFCRLVFWIKRPTGIIAQTTIASIYQQRYYGKKIPIKVIPNALREVNLFPAIERENFILGVGRFNDTLKGFDRLIQAFSKIDNKSWNLVFAGGDQDGQYLKDQAKELGVLHRIKFMGKVKEIDKLYASAGIFVIPSRSEGFPNALCEAMAAGLPCISYDFVAGPSDIIKNGINGILLEEGNINLLSKEIDHLIKDHKLRKQLGKKAMEIRAELHQDRIIKETQDFINKYV